MFIILLMELIWECDEVVVIPLLMNKWTIANTLWTKFLSHRCIQSSWINRNEKQMHSQVLRAKITTSYLRVRFCERKKKQLRDAFSLFKLQTDGVCVCVCVRVWMNGTMESVPGFWLGFIANQPFMEKLSTCITYFYHIHIVCTGAWCVLTSCFSRFVPHSHVNVPQLLFYLFFPPPFLHSHMIV